MKLNRKTALIFALVLMLASIFSIVALTASAESADVVTEYGTIPADKITDTTNFALFVRKPNETTYTFVNTYKDLFSDKNDKDKDIVNIARQYLKRGNTASTYKAYVGGEAVVYMLNDYATTGQNGGGWNRGLQLDGVLTVDLGGHKLTASAPRLFGFEAGKDDVIGTTDYVSAINLKNGSVTTGSPLVEAFSGSSTYTGNKSCKFICDDVDFTFSGSGYNMMKVRGSFATGQTVDFRAEFSECTFDFSGATNPVFINDSTTSGVAKTSVIFNGSLDDALYIKGLGVGKTLASEDTFGWWVDAYGSAASIDKLTASTKFLLFVRKPGSDVYDFADAHNELFYDAANANNDAVTIARKYLKYGNTAQIYSDYTNGEAVIYMLTDATTSGTNSGGSGWNRAFQLCGTLTIDLGGHTLTASAPRLFGFEANSGDIAGTDYDSAIGIKNGKLVTSKPVVDVFAGSSTFTGTKNCSAVFDNVNFAVSGNNYTLITVRGDFKDGQTIGLNVDMNNCTVKYDYVSCPLTIISDACASGEVDCDVTVCAGEFNSSKFAMSSGFSTEDSVKFTKNEKSERTKFVLAYTATAPSTVYSTDEGDMHLAPTITTNKSTTTYTLTNVSTKYGYVPETVKNAKFLIFYNDLYLDSRGTYYNALDRVKALMIATNGIFKGEELTILMNGDYNHTDSAYANLAQIDGAVTLDLNGKTITQTNKYVLDAVGKALDGTLAGTTVIFKNGTILTKNDPVIRASAPDGGANFSYTGTKKYNFIFDGVTFDKIASADGYAYILSGDSFVDNNDGKKKLNVDVTFDNCVFNSSDGVLFDLSASRLLSSSVTINGGRMITDTMGAHGLMYKTSDANNKLTFGKNSEGNYMTLTMNGSTKTPTATFNNGTLEFVKVSENGETAGFELVEVGLNSYAPKMSITLDASLVMNVYIPVECTQSFTLDGVNYSDLSELENKKVTLDNGKEYYRMTIDMPAKSAARDVKLSAVVAFADSYAGGNFTFSIPKYAKKVISLGSDTERKVVLARKVGNVSEVRCCEVCIYIGEYFEIRDVAYAKVDIRKVAALAKRFDMLDRIDAYDLF